jgi:hypothetical protein
MSRKLLIGLIVGVVFIVVGVIVFRGEQVVISDVFSGGDLGSRMNVDVLVTGMSLERTGNATREGGSNPYPTYEISGVGLLAQAGWTGPEGPTIEFPPVGDPQSVAGHLLGGPIRPVPDLHQQFLAGLYVWSDEFESDGLPPWHLGWVALIFEIGDVQMIYGGGQEEWDSQLSSLSGLLGRTDEVDLILDWVAERHAEREGAATGPITLRFEEEFLPHG